MTERDDFAKAALNGFVSSMGACRVYNLDILVKQSYEIADAMLRLRDNNTATPNCAGVPDADSRVWETPGSSPHPTLTDAEREAVAFAVAHGETVDASWRFALRGLLERTKGGER